MNDFEEVVIGLGIFIPKSIFSTVSIGYSKVIKYMYILRRCKVINKNEKYNIFFILIINKHYFFRISILLNSSQIVISNIYTLNNALCFKYLHNHIPSPITTYPINQYDYNLKLTFMKTPSNKPPPFKNGVFALIFYLHFSTAQNRYNMYSEFIINFNTPNLRR